MKRNPLQILGIKRPIKTVKTTYELEPKSLSNLYGLLPRKQIEKQVEVEEYVVENIDLGDIVLNIGNVGEHYIQEAKDKLRDASTNLDHNLEDCKSKITNMDFYDLANHLTQKYKQASKQLDPVFTKFLRFASKFVEEYRNNKSSIPKTSENNTPRRKTSYL